MQDDTFLLELKKNSLRSFYHVLLCVCVLYESEAGSPDALGAAACGLFASSSKKKSSRNNEIAMLKMCCLPSVRTHYECTEISSNSLFSFSSEANFAAVMDCVPFLLYNSEEIPCYYYFVRMDNMGQL